MDKILGILLMFPIFMNTVKAPKPPEKLDKRVIPYYHILNNKPEKKTIYTMSEEELSSLSISKKAKLLGMSKKNFKLFTKLVNREAGKKMEDKIMVAAVVWNRKYCKQYPNKVKEVIKQPGQFQLKGSKTTEVYGNYKDKKAQLAILLAYRQLKTKQIPHNVLYFNALSYKTSNPNRYKKYKHYNNYFIKDTRCNCKWCTQT